MRKTPNFSVEKVTEAWRICCRYGILTLYAKGENMELPKAFEEKMKTLLGEEFDAYTACYEEPRYYGLRVNTSKISVEEFQKICPFSITPVPWIENGFYYDGEKESPAR